jgi:hypothetical protein
VASHNPPNMKLSHRQVTNDTKLFCLCKSVVTQKGLAFLKGQSREIFRPFFLNRVIRYSSVRCHRCTGKSSKIVVVLSKSQYSFDEQSLELLFGTWVELLMKKLWLKNCNTLPLSILFQSYWNGAELVMVY